MAVYTKLRHKRVASLYADQSCYQDGELVQVWTILEGERKPRKRFVSDLIADHGRQEIFAIVRAQIRAQSDPDTPVSLLS